MSIVALTPSEMKEWSRWLWRSHGIRELPGRTIYRCDLDFQAYLTPWRELTDFEVREERSTHAMLMAFDLCPGTLTIASLWSDILTPLEPLSPLKNFEEAKKLLKVASRNGRLWWGTKKHTDFPSLTSVCYLFPENFHFPLKKIIRTEEPPPTMETKLELI